MGLLRIHYTPLQRYMGYLCTRKAQYAPLRRNMHHGAQGRLCFLKNSGDPDDFLFWWFTENTHKMCVSGKCPCGSHWHTRHTRPSRCCPLHIVHRAQHELKVHNERPYPLPPPSIFSLNFPSYIMYHYNGILGPCAPSGRNMHHQAAMCTMVHKGDYIFWKIQGSQLTDAQSQQLLSLVSIFPKSGFTPLPPSISLTD